MTMIKVPNFETEREEADWWYDNRAALEVEFLRKLKTGAKPGPSRVLQMLAERRGVRIEELRAQHYAKRSTSSEPETHTKLPRSA